MPGSVATIRRTVRRVCSTATAKFRLGAGKAARPALARHPPLIVYIQRGANRFEALRTSGSKVVGDRLGLELPTSRTRFYRIRTGFHVFAGQKRAQFRQELSSFGTC
jgi:hypothetical protein